MQAIPKVAMLAIFVLVAASCGDEDGAGNGSTNGSANAAANASTPNGATNNGGSNGSANGQTGGNATTPNNSTTSNNATPNNVAPNNTNPNNANPNNTGNNSSQPCDFEAVDGVVSIRAESLPINEDWEVQSDVGGFQDEGYIVWTGSSHNNDPTHGVMAIDVRITEPGRYQLDWRVQIGRGTNTTEHNDAWIRFPDADDYYGLKGDAGAEVRRYYKPICEDSAAMDAIEALPNVETANCAEGSTRDGWMKVYSSGAREWRWSARTSDNDASVVTAEFDSPGVYTIEFAARADFFLIDHIVLRAEEVDNDTARSQAETACGG